MSSPLSTTSAQQPTPFSSIRSPTSNQILSPKSRQKTSTNGAGIAGMPRSESEHQVISKAFDFLKETNNNTSNSEPKVLIDKRELEAVREDGRMQAYGWSLPYKNRGVNNNNNNTESTATPTSGTKEPVLNISVPVPVYCRPLFQKDTPAQLKLSCASTINYLFDKSCSPASLVDPSQSPMANLARVHTSCFESIDPHTQLATFKSSHVWICNFNETDTHVSVLDANRPSDLIKQFTLAGVRVHCMLSVSGAVKSELDIDARSEIKLKQQQQQQQHDVSGDSQQQQQDIDSITYIEFDPAKGDPVQAATLAATESSILLILFKQF